MALNFPGSPTNGQTHVENGITYYWDASISAWLLQVPTAPIPVGNTISSNGYYTNRATVTGGINFVEGSGVTILVDPDPSENKANVTITSTGSDSTIAEAAFDQANTVWDSANSNYTFSANTVRLIANTAFDKANANYTYAANTVLLAANSAYANANAAIQTWVDTNRLGFRDRSETTLDYNDTTYTFTLQDAGGGWGYYRQGKLVEISGNKQVVLGSPPADGQYYIYIDANDGTLTSSTSDWTLTDDKVPVATVEWRSGATPKYWIADERHSVGMDRAVHYYFHAVEGAKLISAPTLTGYTVSLDTNAAVTFAISASTLLDQDYLHNISSVGDGNGTSPTNYVVWYRTASDAWTWTYSNVPYKYTPASYIEYDNAGTMTTGQASKYYTTYLLVTGLEGDAGYVVVPGRGEYGSLAEARAESIQNFTWENFEINESVIAYRLIWYTGNSYGSDGRTRLAEAPEVINLSAVTNSSSGAGVDHNTLTNLQGGTVSEYYHLTQAEYEALALSYDAANTVYTYAANNVMLVANSAWDKANTANLTADTADAQSQAAFDQANTVWDSANSNYTFAANTVRLIANTAYDKANTTYTYAANNAMLVANTAYAKANAANITADLADAQSQAAFDQANTVWDSANSNYTFAANTVRLIANTAYDAANTTYTYAANNVMLVANSAWDKANTANVTADLADAQSQAAFDQANAVWDSANSNYTFAANTVRLIANTAYDAANSNYTYAANNVRLIANTAYDKANSANLLAYAALPQSGGTIDGDLVITGNVTISGNTTYANTETLLVGDNTIELNADLPHTVAPSEDAGIQINRGSADANVSLIWDETDDVWKFTNDASVFYTIPTNTAVETAQSKGEAAHATANATYTYAANNAMLAANSAYGVANSTYGYAANNVMLVANTAYAKANTANLLAYKANQNAIAALVSSNSVYTFAANTVRLIANTAYAKANANYTYAANNVMLVANSAWNKANTANLLAYKANQNAIAAFVSSNSVYTFAANTVQLIANTAYDKANTTYTYAANNAMLAANSAFAQANAANLIPVGNTISSNGYYTNRATRRGINFLEGSNITINVDDDPTINVANVTITTSATDDTTAVAAFDQANTVWDSANSNYTYAANNVMLVANSAFAAGNTNYTYSANVVMSAANAAFAQANAANLIPVGNTIASNGYYTNRATRRGINFVEGSGITITVDDDPTINVANVTITGGAGDTTIAEAAFDQANAVWDSANSNYTFSANTVRLIANTAYDKANSTYTYAANNVMLAANSAYDKANANYTYAANNVMLVANSGWNKANTANLLAYKANQNAIAALVSSNSVYTFAANTVRLIANTAYAKANTTYTYAANNAMLAANTAYAKANTTYTYAANNVMLAANSAYGAANTVNVGNTTSGTWTPRAKRQAINFIEGDNITITIDDDATLNVANITIAATGGGASVAVSGAAPGSPTANSLWWNSEIGKMFVYYADGDTNQWVEITQGLKGGGGGGGTTGGASVDVSDTAPADPTANSLWWNSDNGKLYVYYDDGDTEQWVETYPGEVLANGTSEAAAAAAAAYNYANTINSATIAYIIDGGGSAITTGTKGTIEVPFDFQIMRWTILADQSGTANIDMWSRDYSTTLPTKANSMTGNIGITLSSATANQSSAIGNWRMTTINKDNVISYNVYSSSTITRATVSLFGYKV